jgi:sucrose phosphorylase
MKNQVQLITYVDRFGGRTLRQLQSLLASRFPNCFGSVHLLPFFDPIDGADAGFDPVDHTRVDPRIGEWADVRALSHAVDVMADVIVNHISSESPQFRDYLEHGSESSWAPMFLTYDKVFPQGATERELLGIWRPRPGLPFAHVTLGGGQHRLMWTTFTPRQIDIDVESTLAQDYLSGILRTLSANGVTQVRLDAVGYAIKRRGSSCFMTEETFAFIGQFAAQARSLGMDVLVEVHSYYRQQVEIARHVDRVYDFALPPLVLHAFAFKTAGRLKHWLAIRPTNAVTVLDTHDGIGVIDIGSHAHDRAGLPGLVSDQELEQLVEWIHANSQGTSREATGAAASNLDLYQVNCTFFDALGRDERAYLLARAIQFFFPGTPQVYYVGLLAGSNDMTLLRKTGVGRDINRHYYSAEEVDHEIERPVVRGLLELINLRNTHPAFGGTFAVEETPDAELAMKWRCGPHWAKLRIDLALGVHELTYTGIPELAPRLRAFEAVCSRPTRLPEVK